MFLRTIAVNEEIYTKPLNPSSNTGQSRRLNVELFLPPTDIPQYVNSTYRKESDTFIISFKYVDEEKEKELFFQNGVKLIIGIYSGKPLRIELSDFKAKGIDQVKLTQFIQKDLSQLIQARAGQADNIRAKKNLEFADELLKKNAEELSSLQPA